MELDSELIITQVEKYPVLYNPEDENYKNRILKFEAWKKITETVVGELYQILEEKEQRDVCKEVQKKWKTIKDTFLRTLKTQSSKSGSTTSKRRPYIYHQQMSFLLPIIQNRRITGSEEEDISMQRDEETPEKRVSYARKQKQRSESQQFNLEENQASYSTEQDDADKLFLLSLLPKMKALNSSASFDFQIKVMQLLQGYLSDERNLVSQSQPSNFCYSYIKSE